MATIVKAFFGHKYLHKAGYAEEAIPLNTYAQVNLLLFDGENYFIPIWQPSYEPRKKDGTKAISHSSGKWVKGSMLKENELQWASLLADDSPLEIGNLLPHHLRKDYTKSV